MINLTSLIMESEKRSRQLLKPRFMKAIASKKFTSAYNKFLEGYRIYRGLRGAAWYPYWIVQPHKFYRTSKNTNNFYTGLIDRLPSWKDWPKRSRSIICTTEESRSRAYGSILVVFPQNGAKIGICSDDDFWSSFKNIRTRLGIRDMSYFNEIFTKVFREIDPQLGMMAEKLDSENYDEFMHYLYTTVDVEQVIKLCSSDAYSITWGDNKRLTPQDLEKNFKGSWEEYFDQLLDPKMNDFQLKTIETFDVSEDQPAEVWTDSTSLLISESYKEELLQSPSNLKIPPKPGDPNLDITL